MELLRRALLVGCILPGLWLLRLAPLDPVLSVSRVDFVAMQKREAAAVPDEQKSEAQRRKALLPFPVWLEEYLQFNVFSAVGPEWDRFLSSIDRLEREPSTASELGWRTSPDAAPDGQAPYVFFRTDEEPIRAVLDRLAAAGGTTYISFSRPGGDLHYRVDRRAWSRQDFSLAAGFTGTPAPPAALLYPFRYLGLGSIAAGIIFFVLLPRQRPLQARGSRAVMELAALAGAVCLFALPLVAVGGSIQALTRGLFLTVPCWALAAFGVHFFAGPGRNAPDPLAAGSTAAAAPDQAERGDRSASLLFVREGLVFLAMTIGPLIFLIAASMILWNR